MKDDVSLLLWDVAYFSLQIWFDFSSGSQMKAFETILPHIVLLPALLSNTEQGTVLFRVKLIVLMKQYFSKNPNNALCIIHTCYPGWWHHTLWSKSSLSSGHYSTCSFLIFFPKLPSFSTFYHCNLALERYHSTGSTFRISSQVLV